MFKLPRQLPWQELVGPPHSLSLSLKGHTLQTSPSVLRANSGCISMQTALQYKVLLSSDSRQDKRDRWVHLGDSQGFFFFCLLRIWRCLQKPKGWNMKHFYRCQTPPHNKFKTNITHIIASRDLSRHIWEFSSDLGSCYNPLLHMHTLEGPSLATSPAWVARDREIVYVGCLCIIKHSESTESHCILSTNTFLRNVF